MIVVRNKLVLVLVVRALGNMVIVVQNKLVVVHSGIAELPFLADLGGGGGG